LTCFVSDGRQSKSFHVLVGVLFALGDGVGRKVVEERRHYALHHDSWIWES
jgi:hypothetical protein